ncbi:carboxypeptidase-like regulatory domain-containing protein [Microvirga sp. STR05]|uniref:Carboxypeptidase-like regulatory domain-containing protein n=1 Tax=Hymenobacter duratus TaxID=2771356 RepID=A0ABR8JAS6_9BACT|nr:carboxypeptidase-like regulatory domain-containing protein [Hymenobacter duratus]MBD2713715.1 carboxypeptidase-like regulatory domain-containing protein [Hymenobacter duratus]MBR7948617.1 carboxypeptidase-like regulatory domain-containing protein [Microvirga sp. STR05]
MSALHPFFAASPSIILVRRYFVALGLASGLLLAGPAVADDTSAVSDTPATNPTATAVRGRVLNEEGKPLVGATVVWKGSPYGVSTDSDGRYQLPLAAGRTVILVGYAGYTDEEITVRGGGIQNVTLLPTEPTVTAQPVAGATRRTQRSIK